MGVWEWRGWDFRAPVWRRGEGEVASEEKSDDLDVPLPPSRPLLMGNDNYYHVTIWAPSWEGSPLPSQIGMVTYAAVIFQGYTSG